MKNTHYIKTCVATVAALLVGGSAQAVVIGFDMVGSNSQNLVSYTNPWTDAFGSVADGFQIYQRGVSATIPFAVLDDSLGVFPGDGIGIIDDNNTDSFFGVTDTVNPDNSGPVTASWVFDVDGFTDLSVSLDIGAMGDFESSDVFEWTYFVDGGAAMSLFASSVDESGTQTYTMAGGGVYTVNDPMLVDGVLLSNQLQTFSGLALGSGSLLTLSLTASTNGGNEAFAFQNLIVSGDAMAVSEPSVFLLFGLGLALIGFIRKH